MERLTENYLGCNQIKDCSNGTCEEICKEVLDCGVCPISKAIDKLAEYEQAEEDGLLIKIECRCKDCVHVDYAGCSNTTCYCMKNGCFMQEDDFCKYAEKNKLMNTTETIGYADNGGLMSAT